MLSGRSFTRPKCTSNTTILDHVNHNDWNLQRNLILNEFIQRRVPCLTPMLFPAASSAALLKAKTAPKVEPFNARMHPVLTSIPVWKLLSCVQHRCGYLRLIYFSRFNRHEPKMYTVHRDLRRECEIARPSLDRLQQNLL